MSDKVVLKSSEYTQLAASIKEIHESLLERYNNILDIMEDSVATDGAISTIAFSPKISAYMSAVRSNLINNLKPVFEATDTLIDDYTTSISNIDTV